MVARPATEHFADRLENAIRARGNPCVVGLDPTPDLLPVELGRSRPSSPEALADAYLRFGRMVVAAAAEIVPAIKVQVACYERLGWRGFRAFERTVADARAAGLLVIADVKRGDVPHTAAHYAAAHLGAEGSDAVTVNPLLGPDSIEPFLAASGAGRRGIFLLVRTSNPGSWVTQGSTRSRGSLCRILARLTDRLGRGLRGANGWSALGAVVGATHPGEIGPLRRLMPRTIFLLPGFGAQGGRARDLLPAFDRSGFGGLVVASRRVLEPARSSPDPQRVLAAACRAFAKEVRAAIGRPGAVLPPPANP